MDPMIIKREDVERRIVDFSDIASGDGFHLSIPAKFCATSS
jgi:hypothetical protein